jgi:hypothetical protein
MDVATLIDRLQERARIWDELASLNTGPHAFGDIYHICAGELRAELREMDTLPPSAATHSTTPAPPRFSEPPEDS